MSAGFIYTACPEIDDGIDIVDIINSMPAGDYDYMVEALMLDDGADEVADVIAEANSALERLKLEPSDISYITIDGLQCWITGGMSYGDDPTESFSDISLLGNIMWPIIRGGAS